MKHLLTSILALLALTACDTTASLKDLRKVEPNADPYFSALASLYQDYSENELKLYDWWSSKYFADKGLLAAYGKEISPENPDNWDISEGEKRTLRAAREVLMASLTPNIRTHHPRTAAKAVMYYDCWVENLEEGWETEAIETCRDEFYNAVGKLESKRADAPAISEPATTPVETTSSILYFPFDDDRLTDLALEALNELIDYVKSSGNAKVILNGHADRAGTDQYNFTLSERRSRFILDKLLAAGIDPGRISYFAFGETDPQIPTDDGVKEPANRRVEIFIE